MRELKRRFRAAADPLARGLAALGVSANALTVFGFVLNAVAGVVVAGGALTVGGLLYLIFSATDFLDGAVARLTGTAGPFGAFLDSVLDRASEAAILVGLIYWYASRQQPLWAAVCGAVLTGSFLVSYARARAEGLGYDCEVGWGQRPERVVALGAGLILSALEPRVLELVLAAMAMITTITTVQRVGHVAKLGGAQKRPAGGNAP